MLVSGVQQSEPYRYMYNEYFKNTIQQAFSVSPFTNVEAKAWVTCPSPYSKW